MDETIDDYDYALPQHLVAHFPSERRDGARLMLISRQTGTIEHHRVSDLPGLLARGDLLVLNDSRVIKARLLGRRGATGGRWEGLFLEAEGGIWRLMSQSRGKLQPRERVIVERPGGSGPALVLELVARDAAGIWRARPEPNIDPLEALEVYGNVPLPPYIKRERVLPGDAERYQTVYAASPGSVAAPTAGLHMTPELLEQCEQRGIARACVTLHVGPGTFRPVTARRLDHHVMHAERFSLSEQAAARIEQTRRAGGRVVAVGTTSVRAVETAAASGRVEARQGQTELFIRPGHAFRAIDALLTNFHLPRSTLLVLVCAFAGRDLVMRAYARAVLEGYRFYSFGDCMLIV